MKTTIGTDPEFFVEKEGEIVSSIGLFGGTKDDPIQLTDNTSIHEDNVLLELGIKPSSSEDEFVGVIAAAFDDVTEAFPHVTLSKKSTHMFDDDQLKHPMAMEAGCEIDLDAFEQKMNRPVEFKDGLRSAGGHIHFGYENPSIMDSANIVMRMDAFIGVPLVLLDPDKERIKLYGRPSCFRTKEYGLEYRSPSNFWVFDDNMIRWMYQAAHRAYESFLEGTLDHEVFAQARTIMQNADEDSAKEFIEKYKIEMPNG